MKVSLDAESVSSIRKICSVAPKNVTLPGIDGVLIESDDSGSITASVYDMHSAIKYSLALGGNVIEGGNVCIRAQRLRDILSRCEGSADMSCKNDGAVTIKCGCGKFSTQQIASNERTPMPDCIVEESKMIASFTIAHKLMTNIVHSQAEAIEDARISFPAYIGCMSVYCLNGHIHFVRMDGRVAFSIITMKDQKDCEAPLYKEVLVSEDKMHACISVRHINSALNVLDGDLTFKVFDGGVTVQGYSGVVSMRQTSIQIPDVFSAIARYEKNEPIAIGSVDMKIIKDVAESACIAAGGDASSEVSVKIESKNLTVSISGNDGSYDGVVPLLESSVKTDGSVIRYYPKVLLRGVSCLSGVCSMLCYGEASPLMFVQDGAVFMHKSIIMPLKKGA